MRCKGQTRADVHCCTRQFVQGRERQEEGAQKRVTADGLRGRCCEMKPTLRERGEGPWTDAPLLW